MTLQVSEHDAITGEVIVREMTAEEIAEREVAIAAKAEKAAAAQAETELKTTQRQAILDRLGLTVEEAALLLGGN